MFAIFGRFLFFALIVLQCFLLASYPATYEDTSGWYAVTILFLPAALGFWWCMNSNRTDVYYVFIFWTMYMWLGLVPLIGIVFGRIDDKIGSKGFWNPSTLRTTLCITPILLLLIFHTTAASSDLNFRQFTEYSLKAIINLYDGVELLGVILDENECSHGISRDFKNTLIAFACISCLWLPFVMAIDYYSFGEHRTDTLWLMYYVIQAVFETIFLGLRLGLCLGYGITASIFINKNIFLIIFNIRQIFNFCCGTEDESLANQQQNEVNEATAPTRSVQENTARQPTVRMVHPLRSSSVAPSAPPPPFNPEMPN